MGRACQAQPALTARISVISDLADPELMTAALQRLSSDELRTACRLRPDISRHQVSFRADGRKFNFGKEVLVATLLQSLTICPARVTLSNAQKSRISSRDGSCKRDHKSPKQTRKKTKSGLEPRVMATLIRSLGPLWQEMVQADTEFMEGNYERFRGYDGLFMVGAQLKHPSLVALFLESLESQGLSENTPDRGMLSTALRHAASTWQVNIAEVDNLDSSGVCRFLGFVALRRFGIIEPNPDGHLVLGKSQGRFSFAEEPRDGGSSVLDDYLRLDFGISPCMTPPEVVMTVRAKLLTLPASQLMGGNYVSSYLIRAYLGARGLDGQSHSTTIAQYLESVPDKCSWLKKLAVDMDERLVDLCRRLGYTGRVNHLSATTCLLDDERILKVLPADGDLACQMRMRLPELLVAREAYQDIHGFSPSPYKLLELTSERRGGGSLPQEAILLASKRRAAVLAAEQYPKTLGVSEAYPLDPVIARVAVLGMSAAAEVKLTPAEMFALLSQASRLVSLSGKQDWASDTASVVAFLHMSAYHDWAPVHRIQQSQALADFEYHESPESAVSVHQWVSALDRASGIPQAKVRVAKVRIINSMGRASR